MSADDPQELAEEDRILFGAYNLSNQLAAQCRKLADLDNPEYSRDALDVVMSWLMTEFWDQFFSQTEIRNAFNSALDDMNRYAAGSERRC